MKRIRDVGRVRVVHAKRAVYALRQRQRRRRFLNLKRKLQQGQPKSVRRYQAPRRVTPGRGFIVVDAPTDLTMLENTEDCNQFYDTLMKHLHAERPVKVSLFRISRVDPAAILILLAVMIRFKSAGVRFGGDFPRDRAIRTAFERSGFYTALFKTYLERDTYSVSPNHSLHTHAEKKVNAALAATVIEKAATTVWGEPRRAQGVQRILLELMQNTNNHASIDNQGEKHWWLSVDHRRAKKRAVFTFVDFGVGVFSSLDSKGKSSKWYGWRNKFFALFQLMDNAMIMREILEGKLHETITEQSFRGKGLPGIREVLSRRGVSNLRIITNDVCADPGHDQYRLMKVPFQGTLVVWELDTSNTSAPVDDQT